MNFSPQRSANALPLATIVVLGLGFALVPAVQGRLFFFWDNARFHFPLAVGIHEALMSWTLPQWWFPGGSGYPLLGEGNAGLFHPIRLLITWLFPAPLGFMVEIGIYMALSGVTTYFFLREFRLPPLASAFGGIAHMLGGYSLVAVKNIAHLRSLWVLPLVMLLAERFVSDQRKARWIVLGGVAFGVQLLSGNPHYAAITAVASGLYVFFRTWQQAWSQDQSLRSALLHISGFSLSWALSAVIGLSLAGIQIVPQIFHTSESTRVGGMSFEFATTIPANLRYLGQLLLPYAYEQGYNLGDPSLWGGRDFNEVSYRGFYAGMVPAVLAFVAVWRHRGWRWPSPAWALVTVGITGTALALGQQTPLYPALWSLPVFGSLRFPHRFLAIPAFCLACVAAFGLASLIESRSSTDGSGRANTGSGGRGILPLAAVLVLAAAGAAYLWLSPPPWLLVARDFERGTLISLALAGAACGLVMSVMSTSGAAQRLVCVGLIAFTVGDLLWFRSRSGYAPAMRVQEVMAPPPMAEFLRRDDTTFRILSLERWERMGPRNDLIFDFAQVHANMLWGLDSADPFESLMLRRYFIVHEAVSWELFESPASAARMQGFLGAMNVKYVIAPLSLTLHGWEAVHETPTARAWKNPGWRPRGYLVENVVRDELEERAEWADRARKRQDRYHDMVREWGVHAAESQILDKVLAGAIDYTKTAVIEGEDPPPLNHADPDATVAAGAAAWNRLHFTVTTREPSFLVVSNNYYPGWMAMVNGVPARIHRTNWIMSGVFVPAGQSEVILQFRTPGLRLGVAMTLVSLLGVAALIRILRPA